MTIKIVNYMSIPSIPSTPTTAIINHKSRIYYRNKFLHIGHLQTIFYNNDYAGKCNGICYAIIDDRQEPIQKEEIMQDLNYLETKHIIPISVREYSAHVLIYTRELLRSGEAYMTTWDHNIINNWNRELDHPTGNHVINLKSPAGTKPPTIGYFKHSYSERASAYELVFIFDYIIKVLDHILGVTDVVCTSNQDIVDESINNYFNGRRRINYHYIEPYRIFDFKYSKRDWPNLDENDGRLLTLKGLRRRHIPQHILYSFYNHAENDKKINIGQLSVLLKNSLNITCDRVFGIIEPLKVTISNWTPKTTEFIRKANNPLKDGDSHMVPLTNTLYIEKNDFGKVGGYLGKICLHNEARLRHSYVIYCHDVTLDETGEPAELFVKYYSKDDKIRSCIHWISSEWEKEPVKVAF